jgi:type VI secretion system protein ImpK
MNRVNRVSHEVFNALGQLRAAGQGAVPVPDILHARLKAFVERAMRTAAEIGFGQHDVHDLGYVLAALTDEVVLGLGVDTVRDFWLPRALQLQLFNENIAGEGVFQRLEALMTEPARAEVLRVYYAALLFGFQGKYRVRGGEIELADTTERAAHALRQFGALKDAPLSPSGLMTRERAVSKQRQFPIVWVSAGILLVSVALFAIMLMAGGAQVDGVVQDLERSDSPAGTGQ